MIRILILILTAARRAVFSLSAPTHPVKPMIKVIAPKQKEEFSNEHQCESQQAGDL